MSSPTLTAFSWGYWGWGTTVPRFLEAAAAAEAARGYAPPAFADVRLRRSVRAPGFRDSAFESAVGPRRYRWFKRLGNGAIETGERGAVWIADPTESEALLEYVEQQARERRRVLFFCACELLEDDGTPRCHRRLVADLLLASARRRDVGLTLVEWPGGEPEEREVVLRSWDGNRGQTVQLGSTLPENGLATLPWFSLVRLRVGGETRAILSGPAAFKRGHWALPVLERADGEDEAGLAALCETARKECARRGLKPRSTR